MDLVTFDNSATIRLITTLVAILAFGGLVILALILGFRNGINFATKLVQEANNSEPFLNAVEYAGKNVDPSVILGILDITRILLGGNTDVSQLIEQARKLIVHVTDGLPNTPTPATTTTGAAGTTVVTANAAEPKPGDGGVG